MKEEIMNRIENLFGYMCRTCLCKEQTFHSLRKVAHVGQNLGILEMLATTTPQITIQPGEDKLPEYICGPCMNKLQIAYHFQQLCITSDRSLRSMLVELNCSKSSSEDVDSSRKKIQDKQQLVEETTEIALISPKTELIETDLQEENFVEFFSENDGQVDLLDEEAMSVQSSDYIPNCESNFSSSEEVSSDLSEEVEKKPSKIQRKKVVKERKPSTHTTRSTRTTRITRTSTMHNETGIDEIEKPNERNRRNGHFPCPECGKDFDRPYRLKRHLGVHSPLRPFQCDICKYRFVQESHLACHKGLHEANKTDDKKLPPEGFKCMECPRRFQKRESLSAHIQIHRKALPGQVFRCEYCPKSFRKFTLLTKHSRTHPENQKFKCHLCSKTFALNAHLIEHVNKHNGLKPFVCVFCNKAFSQNSTLKDHLRTHTGETPFLCPQCGKSFKNSSNMRQHLMRHSGEKRYQCPECPSRFACQSDQIKHMSTHNKVKPHVCDICGSTFTRSYTLAKHKYIHTGERPHKCEECHMTFVFIDHMRRHMRTHTGEKPYKCKFCVRAYAESGDLTKHMRTHVGEKTYICKECPAAFKYLAELRVHRIEHYKAGTSNDGDNEKTPINATIKEELKSSSKNKDSENEEHKEEVAMETDKGASTK